jgi:osmoprotectant transport system permease protein
MTRCCSSPRNARMIKSLKDTLAPLIGKIDVELMRAANLRADRDEDKETPAQAARWLWERIAKPSD